jgi:hypothetical protein
MRNPLKGFFRWANVAASWPVASGPARLVAKLARVPRPPLRWRLIQRPTFDNALATVEIDGRSAVVRWTTPSSETSMTEVGEASLT